jgi:hypothetical protein
MSQPIALRLGIQLESCVKFDDYDDAHGSLRIPSGPHLMLIGAVPLIGVFVPGLRTCPDGGAPAEAQPRGAVAIIQTAA